jgi:hypothetical protein
MVKPETNGQGFTVRGHCVPGQSNIEDLGPKISLNHQSDLFYNVDDLRIKIFKLIFR